MPKSNAQLENQAEKEEKEGVLAQGPAAIRHVIPRIEKGCCDTLIFEKPEKER